MELGTKAETAVVRNCIIKAEAIIDEGGVINTKGCVYPNEAEYEVSSSGSSDNIIVLCDYRGCGHCQKK